MGLVISLLVNALAFYIVAYLVPGFEIVGYQPLLVAAVVWGILSLFVKPVLTLFTLPLNLLTLGLFGFVINALLIMVVDRFVAGFSVDGFVTALWVAVLLSIVNAFLGMLKKA